MPPVTVDCVWKDNGFHCIIGDEAIDAAIHIVNIVISPNVVTLHGPGRIYAEGLYCFLTESDSRRMLMCKESLPIIKERYYENEIVKRFGYTEDDLKPYIAYEGL